MLPQIPGSRRVIPLVISQTETEHLRRLLEQDEAWVGRARWVRWLEDGQLSDTMPIDDMEHDDRIAACAWLRQQRHALHGTVEGGRRAPDGWVEDLPLYRGLCPDDDVLAARTRLWARARP